MNTNQVNPYPLREQIARCSKQVKSRNYQSQPMSPNYSKLFFLFFDHAQPSQMQEAFRKAIQ